MPYRGQCLVHRSQILMARGAWDDASAEAERACAQLAEVGHPALGYALYQQGELHRVRGDLDRAELAYRAASRQGREPNPGFCLLRMAQGHLDDAAASARRMLDETRTSLDRPAILAAVVEVLIAAGALDEAMTACDELDRCAAQGAELLRAMASKSRASLLHASGDDHGAAVAVRGALVSWRQLDMPFEEARTRALAARILTALGDRDAAELERQSAQVTFERLAARTELADLRRGTPSPVAPLTDRECEVLRLVAVGSTNRDIADALVISEHTVARHMQNIFAKLGVSSRAAATAWAYEHRVV